MASKPQKPSPDYPLYPHKTRRWAKKVQGKTRYYGPWDDPEGALASYQAEVAGKASASSQPQRASAKGASIPNITAKTKPAKPHPAYPLTAHSSGRWCKKVKGKLHYFGKWDDPQAALDLWLEQKDDLLAGREPRVSGGGLTVHSLVNQFLAAKENLIATGELKKRTWDDYFIICKVIQKTLGKGRAVVDLLPADFQKLRDAFAKTHGPVALTNDIGRSRVVFNFAYKQRLIDQPLRYGDGFKKPSRAVLRRERHKRGKKLFEAAQIRALLGIASPQIKAMILLGINAALGNADCSRLMKADIQGTWLHFPREKTGIDRKCKLWPETLAALAEIKRPTPKDKAHAGHVFITKRGFLWDAKGKGLRDNPIAKEVYKLLKTLDIYRPGLGYYALRHTFKTVGNQTLDYAAVASIMGHAAGQNDMDAVYTEEIGDNRLVAVVKHVRRWLFKGKLSRDKALPASPSPASEPSAAPGKPQDHPE